MARIYAHRGASAEYPENTLPAFGRAVELGAFGIELDVHLARDGQPVVIHDETVDRTTAGRGRVADMDLVDLQRLDAGGGSRIPTLGEALDLVTGRLHVDIEVKAAAAADAVVRATRQRPTLGFAISSFDHDVLRHVRKTAPDIELWPLTIGASDDALATAGELRSPYLALNDAFVNADVVDYLRAQGIEAWVWTVNDADRAAELTRIGVAGICTDDPSTLLRRSGA